MKSVYGKIIISIFTLLVSIIVFSFCFRKYECKTVTKNHDDYCYGGSYCIPSKIEETKVCRFKK